MNLVGQHLLARAVLAGYQYVGVGRCHLSYHKSEFLHARSHAPVHAALAAAGIRAAGRLAARLLQRGYQLVVVKRLYDEVSGARLNPAYGQFDVGIRRKQHHLGLRTHLLNLSKPIKSLVAAVYSALKVHVEQHHVRLVLTQVRRNIVRIGYGDNMLKGVLEQHLHGGQDVAVVVYNKYCSLFHFNAKIGCITDKSKSV